MGKDSIFLSFWLKINHYLVDISIYFAYFVDMNQKE